MSVIVTNIYLRKDTLTRVPRCVRRLVLRRLDDDVTKPRPVPPPPPPPTSNGKVRQQRNGGVWTVGDGAGPVSDDVELASAQRAARRRVVDSSDCDDSVMVDSRDRRSRDLAPVPDGGTHHR